MLPLLSRKCFPAEKKGDSDLASCCFFSSFFFLLPPLGNIGAASVLGEWASILVYLFYLNSPSPPPSDTEKRFPTKKKEERKRKPSRIFSFIGRGRKVPLNKIKIGSPRKSPLRLSYSLAKLIFRIWGETRGGGVFPASPLNMHEYRISAGPPPTGRSKGRFNKHLLTLKTPVLKWHFCSTFFWKPW